MDHRHQSPTNLSPMAMDQQAAAVSDIAKVKTMTAANSSSSSNDDESTHDVISSTNGSFACKFCEKKFHTKQALGGHQNAHKAQRAQPASQQHVVGSMMTSLIFNNSSRPFHAHPNNQLGYSYYQPRQQQPYALIHNLAAPVNRAPGGLFAFNNNNAAAINNNNHRPVLGFANVPARFVGSNFYTLVPPPPSLMLARVPAASNYVRFPNMNPFPAAAGYVNLAGRAVEEEADDETGLDLSLKLGYSNRG